jgi:hypothetical protein
VQPQTPAALGRLKKGQCENDAEQTENAHGSIVDQCAAETNGGCLAYPSASAGYREVASDDGKKGSQVPLGPDAAPAASSLSGTKRLPPVQHSGALHDPALND